MKITLRKNLLILVAILLLGLLLRVVFINSSPPSLYGDELTITLDAYSLLKTGRDQLGNFLPLTFPMGAGRPAGYVYGSIPFVALFGPSALGVRTLSILSGIGIIVLLYFFGRRLFSERVGLSAAAIGALSPWDISLSRGGFEAHFALFLSFLGVYLFMKAKEKSMYYLLSALSFGLTLHTYPTYKVSLLLFLPLLFWFQRTREIFSNGKKYFLGGVLILLSLGMLSLSQTFLSGSETRFFGINIFLQSKDSTLQKINFERGISELPKNLSKYFHNKPVEYSKIFIENYLQNFSLDFLILHGDRNPRHNMATMGEIYFVEIILIFVGLLNFWQRQKMTLIFLILWILLAPVPTATVDLPHALRSSFMLPPLIILSALGLTAVLKSKNKILLSSILLLFFVQFIFFIQKIYFLAPNAYSNFWSYPAKLAVQIAIQNKDKYSYIIISDKIDDIEFAYPVYMKINAESVISQNKRKTILGNYPMKKFGNVFIGSIAENDLTEYMNRLSGSVLYLGSQFEGNYLKDFEIITGPDNKPAITAKRKW